MRLLASIILAAAAVSLPGCGFTPVYKTVEDNDGAGPLSTVRLGTITSSDTATPILTRAFERRTARPAETNVKYELYVAVTESAQPLAIQIDDSVTRYNYRMRGAYTLVELATGARSKGNADATVSFNIVSSQYSTLFAENDAREKAARVLVEDIERDIVEAILAPAEAAARAASAASQ